MNNKKAYKYLTTFCLCFFINTVVFAQKDSQKLMIVAYDGLNWYPYILTIAKKKNKWFKVQNIKNPLGVTMQPKTGDLFIKDINQKFYHYKMYKSLLSSKPLNGFNKKNGYTQLRAHDDGLIAVELINGKSRKTKIVSIKSKESKPHIMLKQVSSQFHPYKYKNYLYYANVSCKLECSPLIQEVWRKNLVSGATKQLSLLNATSYLHSVDVNNHHGFLSSNKSGFYHIARIDLQTQKITWITSGDSTNTFPSIANNGDLYFIQQKYLTSKLIILKNKQAYLNGNTQNIYQEIPLPSEVQKIRYLEVSNYE
ncbi:MAG: hypothetical protein FE834_05660 [Gammaproteobacteria bacterium]|nr:hypothetical protein [Gammaproteobacteria bacterium]